MSRSPSRMNGGRKRPQHRAATISNRHAHDSGENRKHKALCKQLPNHPATAGTQRGPQGSFPSRDAQPAPSSRFATLTQAISRTRPTIPIINPPASTICPRLLTPTAASARGVSATLRLALSFGNAFSNCDAMVFSEASAALMLTPSFSRPTTAVVRNLRSLKLSLKKPASTRGYMLTGIQTSSALPKINVPLKPRGPTPITE